MESRPISSHAPERSLELIEHFGRIPQLALKGHRDYRT